MNTNDTTLSNGFTDTDRFHAAFDSNARDIMEPVRLSLIESVESCSRDEIIAQTIMNLLGSDMDNGDPCAGRLGRELKVRLVTVAEHMGPDWAQALYHAAVFITKVA